MRWLGSSVPRILLLGCASLISSCTHLYGTVFVNQRATTVVLVYSRSDPGSCPAVAASHTLVPLEQLLSDWRSEEMPVAQSTFDAARCEWRLSVPAKTAVVLDIGPECFDWSLHERYPAVPPQFAYLRVESDSGAIEWRGGELGRVIEEHDSFFDRDFCRIDFN
jgi:hypothetical protein